MTGSKEASKTAPYSSAIAGLIARHSVGGGQPGGQGARLLVIAVANPELDVQVAEEIGILLA